MANLKFAFAHSLSIGDPSVYVNANGYKLPKAAVDQHCQRATNAPFLLFVCIKLPFCQCFRDTRLSLQPFP
jgi:hypothetical protein